MKGTKKRKSGEHSGEIRNPPKKFFKTSSSSNDDNFLRNQAIDGKNETLSVVESDKQCAADLKNTETAVENIRNEDEDIVTESIKDIVNTMSIPEDGCQLIVEAVTRELKRALHPLPEDWILMPFGSFINGLACHGSDLDFFLQTSARSPSQIQSLLKTTAQALRRSKSFEKVIPIPGARVPIVRFTHKKITCDCDLSFTNEIGVRNTLLTRFYLSLNRHLKSLVLFLKYLLELHDLHGCQKITTYMLFWLVVYYMQQRDILPPVRAVRQSVRESYIVDGWDARVPSPQDVTVHDSLSLFDHLKAFLKFYSEFSFTRYIISPHIARPLLLQDFDNLRLPFDCFGVYLNRVNSVEVGTFNSRSMNLQDPTELNLNITRQVELAPSNQFGSFCHRFFRFFDCEIAGKLVTGQPLKDILPRTLPKSYNHLPNDCIQQEIFQLTEKRLADNHSLRATFNVNGVFYFANRLETVMESHYKCSIQKTISDRITRIRLCKGAPRRTVLPKAYFNFKTVNENEDDEPASSRKESLEDELFVLIDSNFSGEEISIRFEGKVRVLQQIQCERIVRMLIQEPDE